MNEQAKQAVFEIRHLQTWFPVRKGVFKRHIGDLKAVDDVSLTVYQGGNAWNRRRIRLWKIHAWKIHHAAGESNRRRGIL